MGWMTSYYVMHRLSRKKSDSPARNPKSWKVVATMDNTTVPDDIPLTEQAVEHWKKTKNISGYATFDTLSPTDIRSIVSAGKRGEIVMNPNRWRGAAYYSILRLRSDFGRGY